MSRINAAVEDWARTVLAESPDLVVIQHGLVTVQVPQVMDSRRLLWGSRVGR